MLACLESWRPRRRSRNEEWQLWHVGRCVTASRCCKQTFFFFFLPYTQTSFAMHNRSKVWWLIKSLGIEAIYWWLPMKILKSLFIRTYLLCRVFQLMGNSVWACWGMLRHDLRQEQNWRLVRKPCASHETWLHTPYVPRATAAKQ